MAKNKNNSFLSTPKKPKPHRHIPREFKHRVFALPDDVCFDLIEFSRIHRDTADLKTEPLSWREGLRGVLTSSRKGGV